MTGDTARPLRRMLLPDLDGELAAATAIVEETLLWACPGPGDDADLLDPAGVLGAGADALGTLRVAIGRAEPLGLYGPDGRYEHEPVVAVEVAGETVDAFGAAVAALAACALPGGGDRVLGEDLDGYAADRGTTVQAIVETAARFHGLVDLAWGPDHDLLAGPLERARANLAPVVLGDDEEAAYRRLRDRWVAMWHDFDALARWTY